ncbi:cysteine-rich small secreted protein CSS [Plasmodium brasilianum]|uniref:Cysteine-rich small secreted protein CSS n=1 Tax=Plasmodium brasilianum TaxID=5824 RepID=A0ACB9Y658_PLABR|nr:cysteine-rich small secreted protein CSS [Plasmodium brasilianum]
MKKGLTTVVFFFLLMDGKGIKGVSEHNIVVGTEKKANIDESSGRSQSGQSNQSSQSSENNEIRRNVCTCDFTEKLNFMPKQKTKIYCELKPHHGEEIRILANKEYEVKCFNNSKVYCPVKGYFINNADIATYSQKLKYQVKDITHRDKTVSEYHLTIDKDASDILFICSIKPRQVSELLEGEVKIDLKREISEEYSVAMEDNIHMCDFSKGNLNISPTTGFYYKNSRSVNCIYNVLRNKLFLIKLPKLDIVTEKILPSVVNCLSEYPYINFNLKHVEETEDSISLHLTFGDFKKAFNLSCELDLSEFTVQPCAVGKKGNVTFYFNV